MARKKLINPPTEPIAEANTDGEIPKTGTMIPIDVRCGDCYHFSHQRANRYDAICEKLGVLAIARPCTEFTPDARIFDLTNKEGRDLREFINHVPANKLHLYAALLVQERITRRAGFRHGEMVYIRIFPDDYLSNFVRAWVIQVKRQIVFVQGMDKKFRGTFTLPSVLDAGDFTKKKQALIKSKKLIDPNLHSYTRWRPKIHSDYEPPTLDELLSFGKSQKDKVRTTSGKDKKTGLKWHATSVRG